MRFPTNTRINSDQIIEISKVKLEAYKIELEALKMLWDVGEIEKDVYVKRIKEYVVAVRIEKEVNIPY